MLQNIKSYNQIKSAVRECAQIVCANGIKIKMSCSFNQVLIDFCADDIPSPFFGVGKKAPIAKANLQYVHFSIGVDIRLFHFRIKITLF